jgi:Tat protein secretion system quality control protein TatD with DNase activity
MSHPATGPGGRPVNVPANLPRIAAGLADHLGVPAADLAALCEANWRRFFGRPGSGA